jgi:uncharacterized membrane protein YraQ (UPF0718 family)
MNELIPIIEFVARAVWQVWPAFLVSVLLGVLVRALKLDGVIRRAFSGHVGLSILLATAVGAFSPFCSCTVVPVVSGLLLSGVPLAPVMAFWVASPTMDPEIFALSVATLGWPLATARLLATLAISLGAGYLTLLLTRTGLLHGSALRQAEVETECCSAAPSNVSFSPAPALLPVSGLLVATPTLTPAIAAGSSAGGCSSGSCAPPAAPAHASRPRWLEDLAASVQALDWRQVGRSVAAQSWELGRWLLLAFLLEALITQYVPQAAIAGILGQDNPLAVLLAALVGVPLYLNNISALPIVSGLLAQGMQPGAAIAFLIAGPVTTIPAMTAVWGIAERRVFALYLAIGLGGSILAGILTNLFFHG